MFYISKNIIMNTKNISWIFCLSSAAAYHEWGTNVPRAFNMLSSNISSIRKIGMVRYVPTHDITNNLISLPTGNYVTNEDRTILEIMNYLLIDEFTSQEMEDYDIENKLDYLREFNNEHHYCTPENFELALECYYEWISDPH